MRNKVFANAEFLPKFVPIPHRLKLGLLFDGTNLQCWRVLLQDALVVELPELLAGILACDSFEDLCAAGMLVYKVCKERWVSREITL